MKGDLAKLSVPRTSIFYFFMAKNTPKGHFFYFFTFFTIPDSNSVYLGRSFCKPSIAIFGDLEINFKNCRADITKPQLAISRFKIDGRPKKQFLQICLCSRSIQAKTLFDFLFFKTLISLDHRTLPRMPYPSNHNTPPSGPRSHPNPFSDKKPNTRQFGRPDKIIFFQNRVVGDYL